MGYIVERQANTLQNLLAFARLQPFPRPDIVAYDGNGEFEKPDGNDRPPTSDLFHAIQTVIADKARPLSTADPPEIRRFDAAIFTALQRTPQGHRRSPAPLVGAGGDRRIRACCQGAMVVEVFERRRGGVEPDRSSTIDAGNRRRPAAVPVPCGLVGTLPAQPAMGRFRRCGPQIRCRHTVPGMILW